MKDTHISTGETRIPIPIPIHTIHTIHTYIHTYQQTHGNHNPTFKDFISWIEKQKKIHVTTTFPPLLWKVYRECVSKREPFDVKPNHLLEAFMKRYIQETFIQFNTQVQITQYFQQVNITNLQNQTCGWCNRSAKYRILLNDKWQLACLRHKRALQSRIKAWAEIGGQQK